MSENQAPRTSLRPQTAEEVRNRILSEEFGDTEFRYSIDPALSQNALARLGYDQGVDALFMGRPSGTARSPTASFVGDVETEAERLMGRSLLREYNQRFPEKQGVVAPNTIFYGDEFASSPAALSHEYAHLGYDVLEQLGLLPEGIDQLGRDPEETLIEVSDLPYEETMVNLPARLQKPGAEQKRFGDTIQFDPRQPGAAEMAAQVQAAAQAERERRGAPPFTPSVPAEEQGIGAMFRRMLGFD